MRATTKTDQPMEKGRVLLAARYLWGYEGVSLQLRSLANRLQDQGWTVGLVSGTDYERRRQYDTLKWFDDNLRHHFVPFPDRLDWSKGIQFLQALQNLHRVIRAFSPDLIHIHSLSLSPYFFFLRNIHKKPLVSTVHSNPALERRDIKVGAAINRWLPDFLGDELIAISTDLARSFVEDLNVPPDRVHVIHHGIDSQHFRPPTDQERREARASFGIHPCEQVVCLVGQLEPVKGHRVLLDSVKTLREDGQSIRAICAGEGNLRDDLLRYTDTLGLGTSVSFPGFVDSRSVYWASDIMVLPSYREGFPLVVPEAMLCGLPVIRTPAAGAEDQIDDGYNGFIIPFNSPLDLTRRIQDLIHRPAKRAKLGRNALDTARARFSLDESMTLVQSLYLSMINNDGDI